MSSLADVNSNMESNRNGVQNQQGQLPLVAASSGGGQDRFVPVNANASIVNGSHNPPIPGANQAEIDQLRARFPRHQHLIHHPRACLADADVIPLGIDSYAFVMAAKMNISGGREIPVAMKIFYSPKKGYLECQNYLDLDHPNILKCFGFSVTPTANPKVCLLLELGSPWLRPHAENEDTRSRFTPDERGRRLPTPSPRVPFSAIEAKECALQIARGLAHLHDRGVVHADLTHQNIIIAQDVLKIGDLGSAKASGTPMERISSTRRYAPPEFVNWNDSNNQVLLLPSFDVFSFGVILASMVGVDPNVIQGSVADPHPRRLKKKLIELVRRCLNIEARNRPKNAGEIVTILEGLTDEDATERNDNNNDDDDDNNDDGHVDGGADGGDHGSDPHRDDNGSGCKHDVSDELWTNEQFLGLRYKFVAEEAIKLSFQEETSSRLSSVVFSQTIDDSSHPLFANFMNPKIHSEKYKLENFRMLRSSLLSSIFLGAHKNNHERLLNKERMNNRHRIGINNLNKQQYLEDPSKIGKYPRFSRILFAWHATSLNKVGDVLTHGPSRRGFGIDGVFYLDADRALEQVSGSLEDKRLILYAVSVSHVTMIDDDLEEDDEDIFDAWLNSTTGEIMIDYRWRALPVAVGELSFVKKNEVEGTKTGFE